MALWLLRNSSVGFSRTVLARTVHQADITWSGDPYIQPDSGVYGTFKARDGRGAWQYNRVFPAFNKNIGFNFGWVMDTMVKDHSESDLCHHKVSIKIKDRV